jgi:hypothetical protein
VAVDLDDEAPVRPGEVAFGAGDAGVDFGCRQAGGPDEAQEEPLEVAAGAVLVRGEEVEQVEQGARAGTSGMTREVSTDRRRVEAAEILGALDQAAEGALGKQGSEVGDGAGRGGDPEGVAGQDVGGVEAHAVGEQVRVFAAGIPWDDQLDRAQVSFGEPPELCRASVAQHRAVAAGEERCHPPALSPERGMADGVDAAEEREQPAAPHLPDYSVIRKTGK